jgi:hypothetical protein
VIGCDDLPVRGHRKSGVATWKIAFAPGVLGFVVEGLFWAEAAATDSTGLAWPAGYFFLLCLAGAIAAPIGIVTRRRDDAWSWAIVSVCVSFLGLLFAAFFWWSGALINCNGECLG